MSGAGSVVLLNQANIAHQIKRGLTGQWPLARDGAVDLFDYSGNVLNLTNNNSVTRADGPSTNLPDAAQFTGANAEYLSHADTPSLEMGNSPFTISAWVFMDSKLGVDAIAGKFTTIGDQREYLLHFDANVDRFRMAATTSGALATFTAVNDDVLGSPSISTWYFIVAGWDGANLFISTNNGAETTVAFAGPVFTGTSVFAIGAYGNPANFWDGRIAQVTIHKRVLTSAERRALV